MPPATRAVWTMLALMGLLWLGVPLALRGNPRQPTSSLRDRERPGPSLLEANRQLADDKGRAVHSPSGDASLGVVPVAFNAGLPSTPSKNNLRPEAPEMLEGPEAPKGPGSSDRAGNPAPIRLSPPRESGPGIRRTRPEADRGLPTLVSVGSSLAVVLGLFFLVAWMLRRTAPGGSAMLPPDAVEVLGRSALSHRVEVHLVRCGNKLLLVSINATDIETLTEITDPEEVHHLTGLCRQAGPGSATTAFRNVLGQLGGQRSDVGATDIDDFGRKASLFPGSTGQEREGHDA